MSQQQLSGGNTISEEQAFLSAIMANPEDHTTKLVYADWLDDRENPRAEILRLRVQVATLQEGWIEAQARLTELEKAAPAKWLVLLDGPVWCIAGNIVESRPYGPGGAETRHGTRLFKPNAKVYLSDLWDCHLVLTPGQEQWQNVRVIGRHRKSVDWIGCILQSSLVVNWRVKLVYQPGALVKLKKEGWAGFQLKKGQFVCPEDKGSSDAIRCLLTALGARFV